MSHQHIFVGNGTSSYGSSSTTEDYLRLPGRSYPSISVFKDILPAGWDIKSLSIEVREYEDIMVTIYRTIDSSITDVLNEFHPELYKNVASFNMEYRDGSSTVEYKIQLTHDFYCNRLPILHKAIYEEQFHKDFENVDTKQV